MLIQLSLSANEKVGVENEREEEENLKGSSHEESKFPSSFQIQESDENILLQNFFPSPQRQKHVIRHPNSIVIGLAS